MFSSILDSSLWESALPTRVLFLTMLAMADRKGYIYGSESGLARRAVISREECQKALTELMAPDPASTDLSRAPENEGRRVETIEAGGWRVLNYEYYRDLRDSDERRYQDRERQARKRSRSVTSGHKMSRPDRNVRHSESAPEASQSQGETETDLEPGSPSAPVSVPTGRTTIPQFHRPTVEQVRAYAAEMGYEDFDPLGFVAYYESVGWKRGKTPMKNWKAAVVTWMRRQ